MCRCRWLCWIQCCVRGVGMDHDDAFDDFIEAFKNNTSPCNTPQQVEKNDDEVQSLLQEA